MPKLEWDWPKWLQGRSLLDKTLDRQAKDLVPKEPATPLLAGLVPAAEPPFTHVLPRKPVSERIHEAAANAIGALHQLAEQEPSVRDFVNAHLKATEPIAQPKIKEPHMAFKFSSIFSTLETFFEGFFQDILSSDAGKALEGGIVAFIKTDVGQLALDAIEYASELPAGTSDDELRAAAVAKLKADLVTAGKDITKIGESVLNLFIEAAYNYATGAVSGLKAIQAKTVKA